MRVIPRTSQSAVDSSLNGFTFFLMIPVCYSITLQECIFHPASLVTPAPCSDFWSAEILRKISLNCSSAVKVNGTPVVLVSVMFEELSTRRHGLVVLRLQQVKGKAWRATFYPHCSEITALNSRLRAVQHERTPYGVGFFFIYFFSPPLNSTGWQHSSTLLA